MSATSKMDCTWGILMGRWLHLEFFKAENFHEADFEGCFVCLNSLRYKIKRVTWNKLAIILSMDVEYDCFDVKFSKVFVF